MPRVSGASQASVEPAIDQGRARHVGRPRAVELTATIAWENCSGEFNRALRVPSQRLWKRRE